jgi:hypothetical protein
MYLSSSKDLDYAEAKFHPTTNDFTIGESYGKWITRGKNGTAKI